MEDILLLIAVTYGVSLGFGFLLQKYLRIPWMFVTLLLGIILSVFGFFKPTVESESFELLATLGMLFLLFIIGFNLDLKKMKTLGKYIVKGTILNVSLGGFFGSLLLYFGFPAHVSNSFLIALIVGLSFATVGEAVLLPILKEFGVIKTTFGQLTLGIGTLDDIIEVLMLAVVAVLPAFLPMAQTQSLPDPSSILLGLGCLLLLTFAMIKFGGKIKRVLEKNHPPPYVPSLLTLLVFFSFVALGGFVFESLATVGAIFGGIVLRG
ncbi:hypothetical protein E3J49_07265, partial [Candidatus Bathyarchaeota archaeon]